MASNSKKKAGKLSYEQLRDVRDQLKRPLTDRPVLIPFGSKAFFPGKLQPKLREGGGGGDDSDNEMVVLAQQDGTQQEMSRSQALEKLGEEMDELIQSKKQKKPLKSALKSSSLTSQKGAAHPKKTSATASNNNEKERTATIFPYFEIREELDNAGNEIRSEAIDVSKHLEYLRQNPDVAENELVPPVNQTTAPPQNEAVEEIPVDDDDDDMPKKKLSDQEFDALSARLEQLARLEEESEKEQSANAASSKKLQSSSWSKGFLNKPAKKKKIQTKMSEASVEKKQSTGVATTGIRNAHTQASTKPIESTVFTGVVKERSSKKPSPQESASSKLKSPPPNTKEESKVRFQDSPQIQEIPRIGTTPVSLLKNPAVYKPRQAARTSPIAANITAPSMTQEQPRKKLSRFAMERQKLR